MKIPRRACASGSWASVASTLALTLAGARDCRSAFAPVNAVSHWLWKDHAIHKDSATLRYTATGYVIHHLASIFWANLFEALAPMQRPRNSGEVLVDAAAVTALAATVDLRCTPDRLTPGFERRLSRRGLVLVYAAFGLGLALSALTSRAEHTD